MKILLTDSGLGGLSICANIIQNINRMDAFPIDTIDIKYVNAVPKMYDGFNLIKPYSKQVSMFNQFLNNVSNKYSPDSIIIVCNSLSAIYPKTDFAKTSDINVEGIIQLGTDLIFKEYNNTQDGIIILGAETTIKENIYQKELVKLGISADNIVSQACPNLANTISNDETGELVKKLIDKYLSITLDKMFDSNENILVYLGCTHYGYRDELFDEYFAEKGISYSIINPNESFFERIFPKVGSSIKYDAIDSTVEFISHYPIPNQEIKTITKFLNDISPETVFALQNFTVDDELY